MVVVQALFLFYNSQLMWQGREIPWPSPVYVYLLGQRSGGLSLGDGGIRKSKSGGCSGQLGDDNGFNDRAKKSAAV